MMNKYKTIILSDIHLGSTYSMANDVIDFLTENKCEKLILNGDIVDGWALKRNSSWTNEHMKCIRKILKLSKNTRIHWIRGNHDDFLADFLPMNLGNISIEESIIHIGENGKVYFVMHGDIFDIFINKMKFVAKIGSMGYDLCLWLNKWYNKFRFFMGWEYFSLSKKIKDSVKEATSFVGSFENHMVEYVKKMGHDGVICGHIHKAEIKKINGIEYMNSGDWVESNTALVEHYGGKWEIIEFKSSKNLDN